MMEHKRILNKNQFRAEQTLFTPIVICFYIKRVPNIHNAHHGLEDKDNDVGDDNDDCEDNIEDAMVIIIDDRCSKRVDNDVSDPAVLRRVAEWSLAATASLWTR